jgi:hypothetical protein
MNEHTAWRCALAQQIAPAYVHTGKASAVVLAGSVARDWADHHSDIEIDVYWQTPPADKDRLQALHEAGGTIDIFWGMPPNEEEYRAIYRRTHGRISQLWPYEQDEWSEHYYVHGVSIGISGFLASTMDRYLDDMLLAGVVDEERQMRLAAIQHAVPLHGVELVRGWQARANTFPRELAAALIRAELGYDEGWWASDMWVERDAMLAMMDLLCHMQRRILRVLLALNRLYLPDPRFKWAEKLVEQMQITPPYLGRRLRRMFEVSPAAAAEEMQLLWEETLGLVYAHFPEIDTQFVMEWYRHRRAVWDDAPPGSLNER